MEAQPMKSYRCRRDECEETFNAPWNRTSHELHDHRGKRKFLLDQLRKLNERIDGVVTSADLARSELTPSKEPYRKEFGSLEMLLERMDIADPESEDSDSYHCARADCDGSFIEQEALTEHIKQEHDMESYVIERLRSIDARVDGAVRQGDIITDNRTPSSTTVRKALGPLGEARSAADIDTLSDTSTTTKDTEDTSDQLSVSPSSSNRAVPTRSTQTTITGYCETTAPSDEPELYECRADGCTFISPTQRRRDRHEAGKHGFSPSTDTEQPYGLGPWWSDQRSRAFSRDDGECQVCAPDEPTVPQMQVHHITPRWRHWFDDRYSWFTVNDLENLVTLCASCHTKLEGKFEDTDPETFARKGKQWLDLEQAFDDVEQPISAD